MRKIQNTLTVGNGITLPKRPHLSPEEIRKISEKYLELEGKTITNLEAFLGSTKFLLYQDLNFLFTFIKEYPGLVFDGKILNLPYNEISGDLKHKQLEKYIGYFNDVSWFMNDLAKEGDNAIKKLKSQIIRNRISIEILYGSINK